MKKLLPIVAIVAISAPTLIILLKLVGLSFNIHDAAQQIAIIAGWSFTAVGVVATILAAFTSNEKEKIYQGAFCALIGISISAYSLLAFIAAIALVAWMDFRGRSLK